MQLFMYLLVTTRLASQPLFITFMDLSSKTVVELKTILQEPGIGCSDYIIKNSYFVRREVVESDIFHPRIYI